MALFHNKKGNMGMSLFLGVILFNIIMYIVIYSANADSTIGNIGSGKGNNYNITASTNDNLTSTGVTHWYSGFQVSVFNMPWWINIFYVVFQGLLISLSVYAMIRGLS